MKKLFLASVAALGILSFSCDKNIVLADGEVPAKVKSFIQTHFASHSIVQTIKDLDGLNKSYEVILSDNVRLEFNRSKEITDIASKTKLPDSVIPAKILEYVLQNYAENHILAWEKDDRRQIVELNNGYDLEFSKTGDFIRIDD